MKQCNQHGSSCPFWSRIIAPTVLFLKKSSVNVQAAVDFWDACRIWLFFVLCPVALARAIYYLVSWSIIFFVGQWFLNWFPSISINWNTNQIADYPTCISKDADGVAKAEKKSLASYASLASFSLVASPDESSANHADNYLFIRSLVLTYNLRWLFWTLLHKVFAEMVGA